MGIAAQKLAKMGIDIAHVDRTGKGVLPFRRYKDLVFISGHGPFDMDGNPLMQGTVGVDLTPEQAYEAARLAAIRMLATIKDAVVTWTTSTISSRRCAPLTAVATFTICPPAPTGSHTSLPVPLASAVSTPAPPWGAAPTAATSPLWPT